MHSDTFLHTYPASHVFFVHINTNLFVTSRSRRLSSLITVWPIDLRRRVWGRVAVVVVVSLGEQRRALQRISF